MPKFETEVVGMQYRVTPSTLRRLKGLAEETPLEVMLVREHDNLHHENAIKVVLRSAPFKGMHIGYVPRHVADVYAVALDENRIWIRSASVTSIDVEEGKATLLISFSTKRKSA